MKTAKILIALTIMILCSMPVFAERYNVLVIPYCAIDTTRQNKMGNVDIEEMLARKFISKMENDGMANAPTINVLHISIKNNPNFIQNAENPMTNVRALAKSYGVSKVLLIMSSTEVQNPHQQKDFWTKLDLPVITHPETNMRLVTTVKMYDAKTDEVTWSDVYYKHVNKIGNVIHDLETPEDRLSAINSYYDELIPKVLDNIEGSKETHAIMLTSLPKDAKINTSVTKENPIIVFIENLKNSFEARRLEKERIKREKALAKSNKNKIKPNFEMQETLAEKNQQNKGFFSKIIKAFNWKFYIVKQDLKIKNVVKEFQDPVKKDDDKTSKTAEKLLKEKHKNIQKGVKKKTAKKTGPGLIETIKTEYNKFMEEAEEKKAEREKIMNENVKYQTVTRTENDMTPAANIYLNVRPRNNSKNTSPKFSYPVNDI